MKQQRQCVDKTVGVMDIDVDVDVDMNVAAAWDVDVNIVVGWMVLAVDVALLLENKGLVLIIREDTGHDVANKHPLSIRFVLVNTYLITTSLPNFQSSLSSFLYCFCNCLPSPELQRSHLSLLFS